MGEQPTQQEATVRAFVIDAGIDTNQSNNAPTSNKMSTEDPFSGFYGEGQAIEPPFNLKVLAQLPEYSSILPQCIDAYETNIDGFGYTLEPIDGVKQDDNGKYPAEVESERKRIKLFFDYCHPELSFSMIRRRTRRDRESTGNGFWEVLRDGKGMPCGLEHLESYTMRLCRLDKEPTEYEIMVRKEDGSYEPIKYRKRFRRYVQIRDGARMYFKEFGDPRPIDTKTGKVLTDAEAKDPKTLLATEVIHFKIYSPHTPYGVPRWIGNLINIQGSRAMEEVNYTHFDNKAIPPLALLVSGKLGENSVKTITDYIEQNIKGRSNYHKILVIEAETQPNPMMGPGQQKIGLELVPLTGAQQKDALFMEYDAKSRDKVRSSFRLPPIYVGETRDYNRSTAEEAKNTAEEQVFAPERDDFDFMINRLLFPALGVKYWKFKSLAATVDNASDMTDMLKVFADVGMTVREARRVIEEILNKSLPEPEPDADWLDMPLKVFMAKLQAGDKENKPEETPDDKTVKKVLHFLLDLRKGIEDELAKHDGRGTESSKGDIGLYLNELPVACCS